MLGSRPVTAGFGLDPHVPEEIGRISVRGAEGMRSGMGLDAAGGDVDLRRAEGEARADEE